MPFQKGHKINLGLKRSEETLQKMRHADCGYKGLHKWINLYKPKPELCEICGIKQGYDWANISGKYLRDFNDWRYLCRNCHLISDGRINNLKNHQGENNPMFGRKHTEETRRKMQLTRLMNADLDRLVGI